MANRILLKRSSVANTAPSALDLEYGELALNFTSGNLYFKDSSNVVQVIASITSGAAAGANTQIQFNNNGALGASANLTFDSNSGNLTTKSIRLTDGAGNASGFKAPSNITQPTIWALPPTDGTVYGNVLATDTTGNLLWRGFTNQLVVYTRSSGAVKVDAINGYLPVETRSGTVLVNIT